MTELEKKYEELKEKMEELKVEIEKQSESKWARKKGAKYRWIDGLGKVDFSFETECPFNDRMHAIANYCSDKPTMERIAKTQNLMRELERFRDENESEEIDWGRDTEKYYIYIDYGDKTAYTAFAYQNRDFGNVYFATEECAKKALKTFGERIKEVMV